MKSEPKTVTSYLLVGIVSFFFIQLGYSQGPVIIPFNGKSISISSNDQEVVNKKSAEIKQALKTKRPDNQKDEPASLDEITTLATELGLRKEIEPNIHLSMTAGDLGFFHKEGWSLDRITLELKARKLILEGAKQKKVFIPTQGDLSFLAQSAIPKLMSQ